MMLLIMQVWSAFCSFLPNRSTHSQIIACLFLSFSSRYQLLVLHYTIVQNVAVAVLPAEWIEARA